MKSFLVALLLWSALPWSVAAQAQEPHRSGVFSSSAHPAGERGCRRLHLYFRPGASQRERYIASDFRRPGTADPQEFEIGGRDGRFDHGSRRLHHRLSHRHQPIYGDEPRVRQVLWQDSAGSRRARRGRASRSTDRDQLQSPCAIFRTVAPSIRRTYKSDESFSPGILTHDRLFVSAMPANMTDAGKASGDPAAQVTFALDQMKAIVEAAGLTLGHMVFVNPYLTPRSRAAIMNELMPAASSSATLRPGPQSKSPACRMARKSNTPALRSAT